MSYPWFNFAVALAAGLLIGLERERSKGEGASRRPAGIRTFSLAVLAGAISYYIGGGLLLATVTGGVAILTAMSYLRAREEDPGLTTEIGLLTAPLLGALATTDIPLASALAAIVAALFVNKAPLHRFVKAVLTDSEISDGVIIAIATLVVWPQLPDRGMGPFQAINPHNLWLFVVLILAIGMCGHVATRVLGRRFGFPLAGLASGFVSSTATIGSMGEHAAKDPASMAAAVAGAALSTVATFLQLSLMLFVIDRATLITMLPPLIAGGAAAALYGLAFTVAAVKSRDAWTARNDPSFSFKTAFWLTVTMATALIAVAALKAWLGETGTILGAGVAGFADAHSAAISVASLVSSGTLTPRDAAIPILVSLTSNSLSKIAAAVVAGSRDFALRIVPGIVLAALASWAALALSIGLHG